MTQKNSLAGPTAGGRTAGRGFAWEPLWGAAVDRIEINPGASPSSATIWFPELRWEADNGLHYGDRVRIRTDWPEASVQATVFSGFMVNFIFRIFRRRREGRGVRAERRGVPGPPMADEHYFAGDRAVCPRTGTITPTTEPPGRWPSRAADFSLGVGPAKRSSTSRKSRAGAEARTKG